MGQTRLMFLVTFWHGAVCGYLLARAVRDHGWRDCWRSPLTGAMAVILATNALMWLL